ncbi:Slc35a3, partial [Symbiodinium necroappetens]
MKGPSGTGPARGLGVFWSALLITFLAWPASAVTITVPAVPKDVSTNATQTQLRGLQGSFVSGKVSAAGLASPAAPPPAAGPSLHRLWRLFRQVLGYFVLACGVAFWLYWVPTKLYNEHENFLAEKLEGRSFSMYLAYRFNFWMDSEGLSAMGIILFVGILSLLTAGAFLYAFFLDESPVTGLWMCFVWASAASVDPQAPAIMGFVGILTTLGGLILLAVLLTTISDYFAKQ